jgi:hypothetical protein
MISEHPVLPCPFCGVEYEETQYALSTLPIEVRDGWIHPENGCEFFKRIQILTIPERQAWNSRAAPWQSIETAPKDGTSIDVWVVIKYPDGSFAHAFRCVDVRWEKERWVESDEPLEGRPDWYDFFGDEDVFVVTHWMPQPTFPGAPP